MWPRILCPKQKRRGEKVKGEKGEEDGSGIEDIEENLGPNDMTVPTSEKLYRTVDGPVCKHLSVGERRMPPPYRGNEPNKYKQGSNSQPKHHQAKTGG